jgi:chorismate mutase
MTPAKRLAKARTNIHAIDAEIVSLLEDRIEAANKAGTAKEAMDKALRDPIREQLVKRYVISLSDLPEQMVEAVWDQIMSCMLEAQRQNKHERSAQKQE